MLSWALALLSAVLLIFTFPKFQIVWFAPVALTPLLIAVAREAKASRRFLLGWVCGIVYWFGVCYWIQFVLAFHGGVGDAVGWLLLLLFCLVKAIHMGAFALVAGILIQRWWAIPAVSAAWVAIEVTHGSMGFAWLALGNAGIDMGIPLRLAPFTGVYGVSFVFMMMATALAVATLGRPRKELLWLAVLPLLVLLPAMPDAIEGRSIALLTQPKISETEDWTEQSVDKMERDQLALTLRGAMNGTDPTPSIAVWPEVPAPLYYFEDARFRNYVDTLARTIHAYLLIGIVAHTSEGAPLNSAVLVSPEGQPLSRYDKVNLVPFGEFVPWPLGLAAKKISTETGDFAAGNRVVVSPVDSHKIGAFICYESVFPNFVRKFVADGAEVLFNISNDGWFGKSAARQQHLDLVRMRAAENRRWVLRSTNDGITATIDPAGRVRSSLPLYQAGASYTKFQYIADQTIYTRFGNWFAALCATAMVMFLLADWLW